MRCPLPVHMIFNPAAANGEEQGQVGHSGAHSPVVAGKGQGKVRGSAGAAAAQREKWGSEGWVTLPLQVHILRSGISADLNRLERMQQSSNCKSCLNYADLLVCS